MQQHHPDRRPHLREVANTLSKGVALLLASVIASAALSSETREGATALVPKTENRVSTAVGGQQRCISCHTFEQGFSHPVEVVPTMAVPRHLPLTDGRVTCTTCHLDTDHAGAPRLAAATPGQAGGVASAPLRSTIGGDSFCAQCHTASPGSARRTHAGTIDRAHDKPVKAGAAAASLAGTIDPQSRACLACHDGSIASDAGRHGAAFSTEQGSKEHPIGIVYGRPRMRGEEPIDLVSPARLDRRIRLFDQTVGCGSCHSVYSTQKDLLVMSNRESRLCLSCHVQ